MSVSRAAPLVPAPALPCPLIALVALTVVGCGVTSSPDAPATPAPHLVVVTVDTLRADHCSAYGYERPTTPVLERLAAEGARFEVAYAPMAITGPTHASLFTSVYPLVHGATKNGVGLSAEVPMLAERLAERGYETAAFVGSFAVSARFGFGRGFDTFDEDFEDSEGTFQWKRWEGMELTSVFDRRANETTDRVIEWLASRRERLAARRDDRPLFLWVHYFDPHTPYGPPPPWDTRFLPPGDRSPLEIDVARYDGEIGFTDEQIGRLVRSIDAALGRARTLLVVTADHGEGLMEHGWPRHGPLLYEEDVRVPLVLRWPGRIPAGTVVDEPVTLLDVVPTVHGLFGIPAGDALVQGADLSPALGDGRVEPVPERSFFFQRRPYRTKRLKTPVAATSSEEAVIHLEGDKFAVRSGPWKYIESEAEGTRELFNLIDDPGERMNRAAAEPGVVEDLSRVIAVWREAQSVLAAAPGRGPTDEDERRLRSLGYVP